MKIGIIDADLIGKKKHRFPNLACMKISSYHKQQGHHVELLTSYDDIENYEKVFISKVFMDTVIPFEPKDKSMKNEEQIADFYKDNILLNMPNVLYGGTGFFYDKAPPLKPEIEHVMPDYHLYDEFVNDQIEAAASLYEEDKQEAIRKRKRNEFKYYFDYSIGFATRGCIRGCSFCVNKNYRQCLKHSPVSEFLDPERKYICLLDDNVLSCKDWKSIFAELNATGKKFQFKQGMDERLLTDEKCEVIFNSNWHGDYLFAFDNIKDRRLIERKLNLIRKYTDSQNVKFYCFCAYNHKTPHLYNYDFWAQDIADLFERIKILMNHRCLPYVMRYKDYELSQYKGMYITIAMWCNQPSFFQKKSFREYCESNFKRNRTSSMRYLIDFEAEYPDIAEKYFDMKCGDVNAN